MEQPNYNIYQRCVYKITVEKSKVRIVLNTVHKKTQNIFQKLVGKMKWQGM